jgi:hypothetical protein
VEQLLDLQSCVCVLDPQPLENACIFIATSSQVVHCGARSLRLFFTTGILVFDEVIHQIVMLAQGSLALREMVLMRFGIGDEKLKGAWHNQVMPRTSKISFCVVQNSYYKNVASMIVANHKRQIMMLKWHLQYGIFNIQYRQPTMNLT